MRKSDDKSQMSSIKDIIKHCLAENAYLQTWYKIKLLRKKLNQQTQDILHIFSKMDTIQNGWCQQNISTNSNKDCILILEINKYQTQVVSC